MTRERPKVDRIACPWLIRRFIDPRSEFLYVPADQVLEVARTSGATPYDIKGVEFGHHGDRCSFDAIVDTYDINDPALDQLATIVRAQMRRAPTLPRNAWVCWRSRTVYLPVLRMTMSNSSTAWSFTMPFTSGAGFSRNS